MTQETLKEKIDDLFNSLPGEGEVRIINKQSFEHLCEAFIKVGKVQACERFKRELEKHVEEI